MGSIARLPHYLSTFREVLESFDYEPDEPDAAQARRAAPKRIYARAYADAAASKGLYKVESFRKAVNLNRRYAVFEVFIFASEQIFDSEHPSQHLRRRNTVDKNFRDHIQIFRMLVRVFPNLPARFHRRQKVC